MIKKHCLPMLMLGGLLLVLPLAACDNGEEPAAEEGMAQGEGTTPAEEPVSSIPAPPADATASETVADASVTTPTEAATTEGSMAEDSPAGEAVTDQEIPHSDVPPPSREVFTDADCDYESWVGTQVDEVKVKEAGRPYRLLKPDSMMTMDHNPERINVVHDDDMKITRVWCG